MVSQKFSVLGVLCLYNLIENHISFSSVIILDINEEISKIYTELNITTPATPQEEKFARKLIYERTEAQNRRIELETEHNKTKEALETERNKTKEALETERNKTREALETERNKTREAKDEAYKYFNRTVKAEDRNEILAAKLLEVGVIRFLRVTLSGFIEKYCNSIADVRRSVKRFKSPTDEDLPTEIREQLNEATGVPHLESKVQTYIGTYRYVYQQTRAILKHADPTDKGIISFKAMFDTKGLSAEDADDKIAKSIALLNYLLSEKLHLDDVVRKINWTDWNAVRAALIECKIVNEEALAAAKGIHQFKLVIMNAI